jgi:hypothetical protein
VRPYPLTVLNGGINRLRIKGGASASKLYDLQNAYISNEGTIVPREGTTRTAALNTNTVGLAAANGIFNIFASTYTTVGVPAGYTLNVLQDPTNTTAYPTTIFFAKPFMGFLFVVASFSDGLTFSYWLQNGGTWTTGAFYTTASIILPLVPNGLAYSANFTLASGITAVPWTAETTVTSGSFVFPNSYNGFMYEAIAVAGTPAHTGAIEPVWPTTIAATIQEFGDFDQSTGGAASSQYTTAASLSPTITDRYGDSNTISNAGIYATNGGTLSTLTLASTKVKTWTAGTAYPPGSVVIPTTGSGGFINAIPNGDLEQGAVDWTFTNVGGGGAAWSIGTGRPYQGTYDLEAAPISLGADGAYATMTTGLTVKPGQSVTLTGYLDPNNSGANLNLWLVLRWYDATNTFISNTLQAAPSQGGGYRLASVTGSAPANAATVKAAVRCGSGGGWTNNAYADLLSWNLETPAAVTDFLYEAVQPSSGVSAATEPAWPTVLDNEVIDGTVTWQAIGTSIITWEAIPLMQAGSAVPTFPTVIGNGVFATSTFTDANGRVIPTGISWIAVSRQVIDTNSPNSIAVALGASHVFEGDNDIVSYSAAVNPIDWSSTNNAGYLPTGLNNYGDNPVAALALYRGNLIVFNAGGYQMWQIDPDPQNMAFLDAQPVGSIWPRAAQSVANDLVFLTEVGVRNLGTIGATANMAIGNSGQPIDPLIIAQIQSGAYPPNSVFSIYYPGRGQYWVIFGNQVFVLTINGLQGIRSWGRYLFPQAITDATLNTNSMGTTSLFLRTTGSLVWQLDATSLLDDGGSETASAFNSIVQWPYLDMGGLGLNKMCIGIDLVGDGACIAQIAFDQQDDSTFVDNVYFATSTGVTTPYFLAIDDTVPGEPLPFPINAPSYSLILTFPSCYDTGGTLSSTGTLNTWSWEAANFYLAPQGGGGVTG